MYIIGTSFGGNIIAALLVQFAIIPAGDETLKISFIVLGIALGIFAVVRQYREEEKAMEIIF